MTKDEKIIKIFRKVLERPLLMQAIKYNVCTSLPHFTLNRVPIQAPRHVTASQNQTGTPIYQIIPDKNNECPESIDQDKQYFQSICLEQIVATSQYQTTQHKKTDTDLYKTAIEADPQKYQKTYPGMPGFCFSILDFTQVLGSSKIIKNITTNNPPDHFL